MRLLLILLLLSISNLIPSPSPSEAGVSGSQNDALTLPSRAMGESLALLSSSPQTVVVACGSTLNCGVSSTANISNVYFEAKSSLPAFIHFCVTASAGTYWVNSSVSNATFPEPHTYNGVNGLFTFIHAKIVPLYTCNSTNSTSIGGGYQSICVPRQFCSLQAVEIEHSGNGTHVLDSLDMRISGTQEYVITLEADLPSSNLPFSPFTSLLSLVLLIPLIMIKRRCRGSHEPNSP